MVNRSDRRSQARGAEIGADSVALNAVDWRRLLGYLRPYSSRMALALLALLISTGLGLAFPMVIVDYSSFQGKSGSISAQSTRSHALQTILPMSRD